MLYTSTRSFNALNCVLFYLLPILLLAFTFCFTMETLMNWSINLCFWTYGQILFLHCAGAYCCKSTVKCFVNAGSISWQPSGCPPSSWLQCRCTGKWGGGSMKWWDKGGQIRPGRSGIGDTAWNVSYTPSQEIHQHGLTGSCTSSISGLSWAHCGSWGWHRCNGKNVYLSSDDIKQPNSFTGCGICRVHQCCCTSIQGFNWDWAFYFIDLLELKIICRFVCLDPG